MEEQQQVVTKKRFIKTLWFKIPVGLVVFYGLLLLFLWGALPGLLKWQLEKQIPERTGHHLTLDKPKIDPIHWDVQLDNVALSTPENAPLAAFKHFDIDLDFPKLFKGEIALSKVELDGLRANLELLPEGKINWTRFIEAFPPSEPSDPNSKPPKVFVASLKVVDAGFTLSDHRTAKGFTTDFTPINIELQNLATRSSKAGEFAVKAQTSMGADIDVSGKVTLEQLAVQGKAALTNLDLQKLGPVMASYTSIPAPKGTLAVSADFDVTLPEGKLQALVSHGDVELSGLQYRPSNKADAGLLAVNQLRLKGAQYDLGKQLASLDSISVSGISARQGAAAAPLLLTALDVGPVKVNLADQHAQVDSAALNGGQVQVVRSAKGDIDLLQTLQALAPPSAPVAGKAVKVDAQAVGKSAPVKPWTWAVKSASVADLAVKYKDLALAKEGLALGLNHIKVSTGNVSQDLSKALSLQVSAAVDSGGSLSASGTVVPSTAAVNMKVGVSKLALKPAQPVLGQYVKLTLVDGAVSTNGQVTLKGSDYSYKGDMLVSSLKLNENDTRKKFLSFTSLSAPSMSVDPKGLNIPRLTLSGLDTAILIAKDRSTNISRILVDNKPAAASGNASASAKASANSSPFLVNINNFKLHESRLQFEDLSLVLPFGTQVEHLNGFVNGLTTRPNARGVLQVKGQVNKYGEMQAKGQVDLAKPTRFMDIGVKFSNIEMLDLTPYSATFANRKINSGKLSLNLNYKIDNDQLNSTNQILIDNLVLGDKVDSPSGRNLPLDLAVALLADSNGRIDLGIPVYGNLNDPQFSVGQVIWKAFTNILTKIVTSPFRALSSLLGGGETLQTVAFNPGAVALSPPQQENLSRLAQAMGKRPNLNLTLTGTYSDADRDAIARRQMKLAVLTKAEGKTPPVDELDGPLVYDSPDIQKALEQVFEQRFGKGEYLGLKAAFEKANPGVLKQSLTGKLLGGISSLLDKPRVFSAAETDALKGKSFYPQLARRIATSEKVSDEQLTQLANQRVNAVVSGLAAQGVAKERLSTATPEKADFKEDEGGVPLKVGVKAN